MRKLLGIICISLGIICLISAVGLLLYNKREEANAENFSADILEVLREEIRVVQEDKDTDSGSTPTISYPQATLFRDMKTVTIDGDECIGIISIPVLELELPVLTDWSYAKLKKAPCHYYGSCYEKDFVIAGHNFYPHFGRVTGLIPGDIIIFTDVTGEEHRYEVTLIETLPAVATEEMIKSGFDLSLYTCTLGGESRVTVRCVRVTGK